MSIALLTAYGIIVFCRMHFLLFCDSVKYFSGWYIPNPSSQKNQAPQSQFLYLRATKPCEYAPALTRSSSKTTVRTKSMSSTTIPPTKHGKSSKATCSAIRGNSRHSELSPCRKAGTASRMHCRSFPVMSKRNICSAPMQIRCTSRIPSAER